MKSTMIDSTRNPNRIKISPIILHTEGRWELQDATNNRFNVGGRGWKSVIKHNCNSKVVSGGPYWMLIERTQDPTKCVYCLEPMPVGIVCLFKLQNWECIRT